MLENAIWHFMLHEMSDNSYKTKIDKYVDNTKINDIFLRDQSLSYLKRTDAINVAVNQ